MLSANIKLKDTLHFVHSLQLEMSNKVQFLKSSNVKDTAESKSVLEAMEELVTQLDRGVNVLTILQSDDS